MLFKNICENTYGWKNVLKYCLKTKNGYLKTQTKHSLVIVKNKSCTVLQKLGQKCTDSQESNLCEKREK